MEDAVFYFFAEGQVWRALVQHEKGVALYAEGNPDQIYFTARESEML